MKGVGYWTGGDYSRYTRQLTPIRTPHLLTYGLRLRTEENNVVLFGSEPPTPIRLPDLSLSISSLYVGIASLHAQADGRGSGAKKDDSKKV